MDKLVSCFSKLDTSVISKHNAALCSDLIEAIQTAQEQRLPFTCSLGDLEKFTLTDFEEGIVSFLDEFNVQTQTEKKFKDIGTMTEFTVIVPEVIVKDSKDINISVVGPSKQIFR